MPDSIYPFPWEVSSSLMCGQNAPTNVLVLVLFRARDPTEMLTRALRCFPMRGHQAHYLYGQEGQMRGDCISHRIQRRTSLLYLGLKNV
jgi:hypothetical protein